MSDVVDKIKKQIAPDDKYKMEVLPEAGKSMAKLGLTDEFYKPSLLERVLWPIEKRLKAIKDFPREIKFFIQRGRRGYSDKDVWDLHSYLEKVIAGSLRHLVTHESMIASHPMGYKEIKNHKDWKRVVKKIAKDIEEGSQYDDLSKNWQDKTRKKKLEQFYDGLANLGKYWFNLWD